MFKDLVRGLLIVGGACFTLIAVPEDGQAFFGWFNKKCACQQTAGYAAYYAPAATPCATQACQYVPQTAYRVQYMTIPVTTYRPVVGCDACGQQVIAMRPLIAYTRQAQVIPYQTYRLAYGVAPAAYPVATVNYAALMTAAGCCNGGTSGLAIGAPMTSPAYPSVAPSSVMGSDSGATVAPSLPSGFVPSGSAPVQGSSSYVPGYSPYAGYPPAAYPPPVSNYAPPAGNGQMPLQAGQPASGQAIQDGSLQTYRQQTNGAVQSAAPVNPANPTNPGSASQSTTGSSPATNGGSSTLQPIPDRNTHEGHDHSSVNGVGTSGDRAAGPMIPDPESRSTQRPKSQQWWAYSPVSLQSNTAMPAAPDGRSATSSTDQDGWRPSKR